MHLKKYKKRGLILLRKILKYDTMWVTMSRGMTL